MKEVKRLKRISFAMTAQGLNPHGRNLLVYVNLYKKTIALISLYGCELWHKSSREIVTVNKL